MSKNKEFTAGELITAAIRICDAFFDAMHDLQQITRVPDTDSLRSSCVEMRRLALNALEKLGWETSKQAEERMQKEAAENIPTEIDLSKDVYYEIRLGVYSKRFNVTNVNAFRDWMWNSGASGRCEMCGPVPGTGDHREFGHYTMRCPVEQDFFEAVLKLFEERAKKQGKEA